MNYDYFNIFIMKSIYYLAIEFANQMSVIIR
jgi:hypothetical protein